ncbi:SpaA isopeptide-forming pilin-related protein [Actinomyces timonensis]|uniref:SpaA isopeptide-forming pilin-related protein n=1 Tax=Actinomyces timonensis TaxID=1288391 RepID=A0AAU8N6L2_9ACTO
MSSRSHALPRASRVARCALLALCALALICVDAVSIPRSLSTTPPAQAADGIFECSPGTVYNVISDGAINKISPDGTVSQVLGNDEHPFDWFYDGDRANGLGIEKNGTGAYFLIQRKNELRIVHYANGEWTGTERIDSYNWGLLDGTYIAGGVQPSTGDYYFGGYEENAGAWTGRFRVWRVPHGYLEAKYIQDVGYIDVGKEIDKGDGNGDLAFDDAGNMFIVRSSSISGITQIYSVTATALAADSGSNYHIPSTTTKADRISGNKAVNGIAFDAEGKLYLSDTNNVGAYDPVSFKNIIPKINKSTIGGQSFSTDLASCGSPATFILKKNIVKRENANDQFKLAVSYDPAGGEIASVQTTGNANGVQKEVIGIFPVMIGTDFSFSESAANGASLSNYSSSWSCTRSGSSTPFAQGQGTGGTVRIPQQSSVVVECTFTNAPLTGSVSWDKTASNAPSQLLPGSEWLLSGPGGTRLAVKDCTSAGQCAGTNDADPAPGKFLVENLPLGDYSLSETVAPKNYKKATSVWSVKITSAQRAARVIGVSNDPLEATLTMTKKTLAVDGSPLPSSRGDWELNVTAEDGSTVVGGTQITWDDGTVDNPWTVTVPPGKDTGTVTISEAAAEGWENKAISCTNADGSPLAVTPTGNPGEGSIPLSPGAQVACEFTNQRKPGTLTWTKTDASTAKEIPGSSWTIKGSGPGAAAVTVTDCVEDGKCQGGIADSDPAPGKFKVTNLPWDQYTVTEAAPPSGYVLDTTARPARISSTSLKVDLGTITNTRATGTVTWKKVDGDNNEALAGSEWTLTGPSFPAATVITDCDSGDCKAKAAGATYYDADPAPGSFRVEGIPADGAALALTESKAPAGYRLDKNPKAFSITVGADGAIVSHVFTDPFPNYKSPVPALPLTGGIGADFFYLGGLGLGLMTVLALAVRQSRRRRS